MRATRMRKAGTGIDFEIYAVLLKAELCREDSETAAVSNVARLDRALRDVHWELKSFFQETKAMATFC